MTMINLTFKEYMFIYMYIGACVCARVFVLVCRNMNNIYLQTHVVIRIKRCLLKIVIC
jgi:hypothetical protein